MSQNATSLSLTEYDKFLIEEYLSLREEIKETKKRIFQLAGLGLAGMPAAYFLAAAYKLDVLIITLPIFICTILLLFFAESRALMRCGKYIKTCIEHLVKKQNQDIKGWEHWLEESAAGESGRRTVDILVVVFFYILFIFYYIAAMLLSVNFCSAKFGTVGLALSLGGYLALFVVFTAFSLKDVRRLVSTR